MSAISPNHLGCYKHQKELEKSKLIPEYVVTIFNDLISEDYHNGMAVVSQNDVVERILEHTECKIERCEIFSLGYLDVEPLFREAGWNVVFDKAAYYETNSKFIFRG